MRLNVEQLECRSVPSATPVATATLSQGVLTVTGTDAAETFTLKVSGANLVLQGPAKNWTFPLNSVARVDANLLGGNDVWNGLAIGFTGSQNIQGGQGNDTITTGAGNDVLQGGQGNDFLYPGAGQDICKGGQGNDTIDLTSGDGGIAGYPADIAYGGDGNDTLIGGANDTLYGEDGNDVLTASGSWMYGATTMYGGPGNDKFYADQGQYYAYDSIFGGQGHDRLFTYDSIGLGNINESIKGIERIG